MLPKVIRPEYNTTLPSTGKKIKYQPFSVKEEKILVLAAESRDNDEMGNAIANILSNCITSPTDLDIHSLSLFDIEYLFLKARAKSAGEKIQVNITDPDDEGYTVRHSISIDKIKVERSEEHTDLIKLDDTIQVKMKYPDLSFFVDGIDLTEISSSVNTICRCISSIVVGEDVYNQGDMSETELTEWVESLTSAQFRNIVNFFDTMPRLSHTINLKNTNTGKPFSIKLQGLADFF